MVEKPKIDFLKQKYELSRGDDEPFLFFGRKLIAGVVMLATVGMIFSYRVSHTTETGHEPTRFSMFSAIKSFMQTENGALEGEQDDRVNLLLTGIGGEGHEGPQLTDTILFASFRPSTKNIAFLSLPRDLVVEIPGHGYQKINHANAYGEMDKKGSGPVVASGVIGNIVQQPIPYYVRVDFDGFAELIDTIGGIDVYVDQAFTDPSYPILGKELDTCGEKNDVENATEQKIPAPNYRCRFTSLSFKQGWMHLDGNTALAYVRSRHGNNGEGSDFARARRQQKLLMAVKDKVFSVSTFFNPIRLHGILNTLQKNIATNLSIPEIVRLGKDLRELKSEDVASHVIDTSPDSPLYEATLNGAYVLLPKNDDWSTIQKMARYIFTKEKPRVSSPKPATVVVQPTEEKQNLSRVEIQNGTHIAGLAFRASQLLSELGNFSVPKVGNASTRDYTHTVIFDLTNGKKPEELKSLQTFFQTDLSVSASGWVSSKVVPKDVTITQEDLKRITQQQQVDFLVVLGENSQNVVLK